MTECYLGYPPPRMKKWIEDHRKQPADDIVGTPVFTYSVNAENNEIELDFGPAMAGKEIAVEVEDV